MKRLVSFSDGLLYQYDRVEPENRLVARTLEKRWEAMLAAKVELEAEHARFMAREPADLTAAEREQIRRLAEDIPAIWHAPTTPPAERKEIVRLMLDRVVVTVVGETELMEVECHWAGGCRTSHQVIRLSAAQLATLLEGLPWHHLQPRSVRRPSTAC